MRYGFACVVECLKLGVMMPFFDARFEQSATPFYLYDEQEIRENARRFLGAFAWHEGFRNYFAVKATPNPHILGILRDEGMGMDCSSTAELALTARIGMGGEDVMFTSNNTAASDFMLAREMGAIINLDDGGHLPFLAECAGLPDLISFRYNPGRQKTGNAIIGRPEEAKFGMPREQLFAAYAAARDAGVTRFGLHTMVASNELDNAYFVETAALLFELVASLTAQLGIRFEFVNLGGGLGIPYRPSQQPIDPQIISEGIKQAYQTIIVANRLSPLKLLMECGRYVTGPHGYLVTRVRHVKRAFKTFVGVDASMHNLMRPGMYGAYHHITVPAKAHLPHDQVVDVTGSLCENNDKFAIDRPLPPLERGDVLVIHDTGAHGHAMGFNYNGKLRSAEYVLRPDGTITLIRRAETLDDLFATLMN